MSSRSNVIHAAQSHLGGPLSSSKAQCHVVAKRSQCHVVLWDFGGRLPRAAPGARAGRPRLALRRCSKSAGSADVHVRPQAFSNARAERPGEGARRGSGEPPSENVGIQENYMTLASQAAHLPAWIGEIKSPLKVGMTAQRRPARPPQAEGPPHKTGAALAEHRNPC